MEKENTPNIPLSEFIDTVAKDSPIKMLEVAAKLIELEAIDNYLNLMYGVRLDVKVKAAEKKMGRFYGRGLIDHFGGDKSYPQIDT